MRDGRTPWSDVTDQFLILNFLHKFIMACLHACMHACMNYDRIRAKCDKPQ